MGRVENEIVANSVSSPKLFWKKLWGVTELSVRPVDLGTETNQIPCQNGETYCTMGTYQVFVT